MSDSIKPPLGVRPKHIVTEERREELSAGIKRYLDARFKIPVKWVEEYNDLIK